MSAEKPKLLIVEDDEGLQRQLRWAYEDYEVIVAGDRLLIPKGAVVPVDATLPEGEALVDESLVTGESRAERIAPAKMF